MRGLPWYWWLVIGAGIAAPIGLIVWMAAEADDSTDAAGFDTPPLPTDPHASRRSTQAEG